MQEPINKLSSVNNIEKYSFRSNGKLLLTGEYFVLDGAKALATPTLPGQTLELKLNKAAKDLIKWNSYDENGKVWFSANYSLSDFKCLTSTDDKIANTLKDILSQLSDLNPSVFSTKGLHDFSTQLDFDRQFGLGTSSTLINNLAQWAAIDPFELLSKTFGGSGYDLACASSKNPILYYLTDEAPHWESVNFNPPFQDKLYLLYLGKKQNSREGIKRYREKSKPSKALIDEVSMLSKAFCEASKQDDFDKLIEEHEQIISNSIELPKVKDVYFKDFPLAAKSLGAWGGDFVLISYGGSWKELKKFTLKIGMENLFPYKSLVL